MIKTKMENLGKMRKNLQELNTDKRHTFTATVKRFGTKSDPWGQPIGTVCLGDVRILGARQRMTDHVWFTYGKQMKGAGDLAVGDRIRFDARVKLYTKGHWKDRKADYKLAYPTKVRRAK